MADAVMAGQGSEIAEVGAGPTATGVVISPRTVGQPGVVLDADPALVAGTVIDGRYRVVRELGAGGMGRVYETVHMFLRRPMAIKLLRRGLATAPEAIARLIQEATLAGQVPHPAVVRVFDCAALADGQVYLAMELLRGESLEQRLRRPGDAAELVPLLAELARGLAAVHRVGVVHRDIKPANVFLALGEGGVQAKLLDFGVAKLLPGASGEAGVRTQAGAVLGTPYYLAPEQARGGAIDGRADLYALGVILYEMLTGTLPFLGANSMAILAQHLHEVPLDPRQAAPERGIPDGVAALTMRLLSKDPALRAGDGDALADELTALMASEGDALRRVAIGGGGAAAATVAPAATVGLVEGPDAATRRVAAPLAEGTGAATQRVDVQLAEGTGAATVRLGSGSVLEGREPAGPRVVVHERAGADTLPLGSSERPVVELSERTGRAAPGSVGWRVRWLAVGAALGVVVVGGGWVAARTMRGPPETRAGEVQRVTPPAVAPAMAGPPGPEAKAVEATRGQVAGQGEAGRGEAGEVTALVQGEAGTAGEVKAPVQGEAGTAGEVKAPVQGEAGTAGEVKGDVTAVELPVEGTKAGGAKGADTRAGGAKGGTDVVTKKPRGGKKKPSEGGTTPTPPPSTPGEPQLKPDVYDP